MPLVKSSYANYLTGLNSGLSRRDLDIILSELLKSLVPLTFQSDENKRVKKV
ncbi:hypothetical protein SK128_017286 [Halocaridina rubra]|uniref:Uncharacterized protein n=1 Tax=Halocaridina rubra TaxID=373956 RepID=A0AAN8WUT3_HALRR